jgi:mRNA interferase RelE/StbE
MPIWFIDFTSEAEDDLGGIDSIIRKRIIDKLDWLQNNFDSITPLALDDKWRGFFKLRVGDWRVIYKIDWNKNRILVVVIDHRTKIYKRKP